jgi:chromosome segregation ATPase
MGLLFFWAGLTGAGTFTENISTKTLQARVFANEILGRGDKSAKLELLEKNSNDLQAEYTRLIQTLSTLQIDKASIESTLNTVEKTGQIAERKIEDKTEDAKSWIQKIFTILQNVFSKKKQEAVEKKEDLTESLVETHQEVTQKTKEELLHQKEVIEIKAKEIEIKIEEIKGKYLEAKTAAMRLRDGLLKLQEAANETNASIKNLGEIFTLDKSEEVMGTGIPAITE